MRVRMILGLVIVYLISNISPANATGYISWNAENGKSSNFSQEISINSVNPHTAFLVYVNLNTEITFVINIALRDPGVYDSEFGALFKQGVEPIPSPDAKCVYYGAKEDGKNFSNCKISNIQLTFPAKVSLSIRKDLTDSTGETWAGYFANVTTGDEYLIARFDIGQANLSIRDVYQYPYPYWVDECQSTPGIQETIWWKPTSTDSKFNFTSTRKSDCGNVTFFAPQSYLNTDGVLMRLNTSKSETRTYKNSLFEILYPEVWNTAYSLATKSAEAESTKNYLSLQNSSDASITQLQSQISLINQQLKKLNSQLKKICSAKKKPTGC